MQIQPENGQHGARDDIKSVTIESLGEFTALAGGFMNIITTDLTINHPLYSALPSPKRRERIIAADARLTFMHGIVVEHVPYEFDRNAEFTPRTYAGEEARLVIDGLWEVVKVAGGRTAVQSVLEFATDPRRA